MVDSEWFASQYEDLTRRTPVHIPAPFNINWPSLDIMVKDKTLSLGIKLETKRMLVHDGNNKWVDTKPKHIKDLAVLYKKGGINLFRSIMNEKERYKKGLAQSQRDEEQIKEEENKVNHQEQHSLNPQVTGPSPEQHSLKPQVGNTSSEIDRNKEIENSMYTEIENRMHTEKENSQIEDKRTILY